MTTRTSVHPYRFFVNQGLSTDMTTVGETHSSSSRLLHCDDTSTSDPGSHNVLELPAT